MFLICFGTRPEIIKLFPLILEFKSRNVPYKTLFTGQHKDLNKMFSNLIPSYDYELSVMNKNQSLNSLTSNILLQSEEIIKNNDFKYIIIQGDTSTSYTLALSAFYHKIKIIHVEAGLRTGNKYEPFPEEINRKMISTIADIHFVPTELSKNNLLKENYLDNIFVVGNTIIDALRIMNIKPKKKDYVVVTLHRRENRDKLDILLKQIDNIPFEIIIVKHPSIDDELYKKYLKNVKILKPLPYLDFLTLIAECKFIISDSGGIQEESTYFKKKILICRNVTERPEVITSGYGKLIGSDIINNLEWAMKPLHNETESPFGDGYSCKKMLNILIDKYINARPN